MFLPALPGDSDSLLYIESGCCGIANLCSDLKLPVLRAWGAQFPSPSQSAFSIQSFNHSIMPGNISAVSDVAAQWVGDWS